jgi:hypothetical protein
MFLASAGFFQPIPTEMSDQPTVQTVSDDEHEPSEGEAAINVEGKESKKRKATGAAAQMSHCRVLFLPLKTANELQPCDAGIIQCYSRRRRWHS